MAKFQEITLPDGTVKLVRIPKTPEEIEEDRKIHERQRLREKLDKERRKAKAKQKSLNAKVYQKPRNQPNQKEKETGDNEQLKDVQYETPKEEKFREVFESLIDKAGDDGCWIWKGKIKNISEIDSDETVGMELAYVVSYKLFKGKIESNKDVVHKCKNPICVNPQHLFLSSQPEYHNVCAISEDINPEYILKI